MFFFSQLFQVSRFFGHFGLSALLAIKIKSASYIFSKSHIFISSRLPLSCNKILDAHLSIDDFIYGVFNLLMEHLIYF